MTEIANVLAVAAVFSGLWTISSIVDRERGRAYSRHKNTYAGT